MSLDKSLRARGALVRHRNVLSRAERIAMLKDAGKWDDQKDIFGLPKVGHRKVTTKKVKVAAAAVPGAEGAVPAEGAAPAAASRSGPRQGCGRRQGPRPGGQGGARQGRLPPRASSPAGGLRSGPGRGPPTIDSARSAFPAPRPASSGRVSFVSSKRFRPFEENTGAAATRVTSPHQGATTMNDPDGLLAQRMGSIDASGIRKVFDLYLRLQNGKYQVP